jgi:hypothetical protein
VERLDRLEATNRDNAKLREELAVVRRELEQVRSERETMRKEIVDDLTTRINKYMATAASAARPAPPAKQNGYMHTVVAGQKVTLYFQTPANFPSFCYAILNPYGEANSVLAANTLYKLFANERFNLNGIVATTAYSQQFLTLAGY